MEITYVKLDTDLNLCVGIDRFNRKPIVFVVVSLQVLSFDRYFAYYFISLLPVVDIHTQETEPPWDAKLEFLPEKWAKKPSIFINYCTSPSKTKHIQSQLYFKKT